MKYSPNEYWDIANLEDNELVDAVWKETLQRYFLYFDTIKTKLPKGFVKIYEKINFHDFRVDEIVFVNNSRKNSYVTILIYDYFKDYGKDLYFKITYRRIKQYECIANSLDNKISWGYDTFELKDNGLWEHRIQCADMTNIKIVFKNIKIEKVRVFNRPS